MITDETEKPSFNQSDCWVCDRDIYTLIFWNETIGEALIEQVSYDDKAFIKDRIQEFQLNDSRPKDLQEKTSSVTAEAMTDSRLNRTHLAKTVKVEGNEVRDDDAGVLIYGRFTNWRP